MKAVSVLALSGLVLGLAACDTGNIKTAADYDPPPPPPVGHPAYDPYAAYGDANAIWQPPVVDRDGGIVKPREPATEWNRPDYEGAPWSGAAKASPFGGPAGTF